MGTGTALARVRGLGAARSGVGHWWRQRLTAVGNLLLVTWFIVSLLRLPTLQYETVIAWLRQPVAAIPMLLLILSVFHHLRLGVQVFIEDYLHAEGNRLLAIVALDFYVVAAAAVSLFSVLRIAFGS